MDQKVTTIDIVRGLLATGYTLFDVILNPGTANAVSKDFAFDDENEEQFIDLINSMIPEGQEESSFAFIVNPGTPQEAQKCARWYPMPDGGGYWLRCRCDYPGAEVLGT